MTKYLFIGGPASGEYHETNGELNVVWHESPVFSVEVSEEADRIKPLGASWAYNLRALALGENYTHVYVLGTLCNGEAINDLLYAYASTQ